MRNELYASEESRGPTLSPTRIIFESRTASSLRFLFWLEPDVSQRPMLWGYHVLGVCSLASRQCVRPDSTSRVIRNLLLTRETRRRDSSPSDAFGCMT